MRDAWLGKDVCCIMNNENYFRVLRRCLGETCIVWWCDGSAQPSGWYCKCIGKRTIERLSANEEELTSWSNQSITGLTS